MRGISNEDFGRLEEKVDALLLLLDPLLTPDEVSEYTGIHIINVYKMLKKIPRSRPGGKLLFVRLSDVQKYLLSNPVSTVNELQAKADEIVRVVNRKNKK